MNPIQATLLSASNHAFNNVSLGGVCFISDLHLSEQMPKTLAQFEHFCQSIATQYDTLIILGDLFEYWLGDDTIEYNETAKKVIDTLITLKAQDKNIGFIAGNRDFLIRDIFAQRANITLLPDPCLLNINGQPTLISHGDLLCTEDKTYQRFRRFAHTKWIQNVFLKAPVSWRISLAKYLRNRSKNTQQNKPFYSACIQDVSKITVDYWFKHSNAKILLHGHTHHASTHLTFNTLRIVLPDWECEDNQLIHWGYISWLPHEKNPELKFFTSNT